jgi:hypothetical protein
LEIDEIDLTAAIKVFGKDGLNGDALSHFILLQITMFAEA